MRTPRTLRRQAGTSLLEVLIAVIILAVGMLGMAALQAITLKNTTSASQRSAAVVQGYAMLDMMRANRATARAGGYDQGWMCADPEADGRVGTDLAVWIGQLQGALGPSACGRITCGAEECTVGVRWDDSRATGGSTGEPEVVEIVSRL